MTKLPSALIGWRGIFHWNGISTLSFEPRHLESKLDWQDDVGLLRHVFSHPGLHHPALSAVLQAWHARWYLWWTLVLVHNHCLFHRRATWLHIFTVSEWGYHVEQATISCGYLISSEWSTSRIFFCQQIQEQCDAVWFCNSYCLPEISSLTQREPASLLSRFFSFNTAFENPSEPGTWIQSRPRIVARWHSFWSGTLWTRFQIFTIWNLMAWQCLYTVIYNLHNYIQLYDYNYL